MEPKHVPFVIERARAEDGAALLQSYGAEYVLIDAQHQITVSAGLRDRFTLTASAYTLRESM